MFPIYCRQDILVLQKKQLHAEEVSMQKETLHHTPTAPAYSRYADIKLVDFHGWELPLHYGPGTIAEHTAVRTGAGLFDVSHMGEIEITGDSSEIFIQQLITNNIEHIGDGQVLYTLMCYPSGGVVDDLIVYKFTKTHFLLIVNASNREKDFAWISRKNPVLQRLETPPTVTDVSESWAQFAVQGPKSEQFVSSLLPEARDIRFFHFRDDLSLLGAPLLISRTGYTGEDGFEIYVHTDDALSLWDHLLLKGSDYGIIPCGLGARDSLRLEAKLPLYGHEITDTITPLEANLHHFVDMDKDFFVGRDSLQKQIAEGIPRTLRGIRMIDRGVPREGYAVYDGSRQTGYVTSGIKSPTLQSFIALVLMKRGSGLKIGDTVSVEIHQSMKRAELVKTPFYKKTGRK